MSRHHAGSSQRRAKALHRLLFNRHDAPCYNGRLSAGFLWELS